MKFKSISMERICRVAISAVFIICTALGTYALDLTGVWKGDDGATYYIRHIPRSPIAVAAAVFLGAKGEVKDDIYWYGQGTGFANVFHGMISKGQVDQISGEWADVPVGAAANNGFLSIAIASPDRLVLLGEPGNFAARTWTRVKPKLPIILLPKKGK